MRPEPRKGGPGSNAAGERGTGRGVTGTHRGGTEPNDKDIRDLNESNQNPLLHVQTTNLRYLYSKHFSNFPLTQAAGTCLWSQLAVTA